MADNSGGGAFFAGLVIGGLVGAAVALLYAPQSGEDTRAQIRDASVELRDKADVAIAEAREAALCLQQQNFRFDVACSSRLKRAIDTRDLILSQTGQQDIPRFEDWRLNERHYGSLQGTDKQAALEQAGADQVWRWRRSYLERANPLKADDPTHPRHDLLYAPPAIQKHPDANQ